MTNRCPKTKGFTLIELLVVIAIIGLLSSVVFASLNSSREKAKVAKARAEMYQIINAVEVARGEINGTLLQVTENGCSACNPTLPVFQASMGKIASKAGVYGGLDKIGLDPWGGVYRMDENEFEFNSTDCRRDYITATGGGSPTVYYFSYFTNYCQANPQGVAGWQSNP